MQVAPGLVSRFCSTPVGGTERTNTCYEVMHNCSPLIYLLYGSSNNLKLNHYLLPRPSLIASIISFAVLLFYGYYKGLFVSSGTEVKFLFLFLFIYFFLFLVSCHYFSSLWDSVVDYVD